MSQHSVLLTTHIIAETFILVTFQLHPSAERSCEQLSQCTQRQAIPSLLVTSSSTAPRGVTPSFCSVSLAKSQADVAYRLVLFLFFSYFFGEPAHPPPGGRL